ncbi:MAG: enoyl-[acyl-carrier protein] reductase [Clostridiales bacterium]|jgi:enoyl-[acyl-carrier protein] reductase II|nr:enoyl-[acyl-carrier protein] reductase [Clostridiales bacterium]MDN5281517.1 enoyl-[acyl-carrier protein] reductase [Candidatus Ozemobacter sp.]
MIETRITKMLGIKYPIIQGGMAWVSSANLVAAVSNAGGLGIFGSGSLEPELVRKEIQTIKSLTDKPFGVNVMLMMPTAPGVVDVCIDEKVPVVTTGAGNPAPFVKRFKEAGIKVIPVVSSVALAKRLERSGVDAVIAEGHESGGHVGEITSMVLIPQVVDAIEIPVIAAGGIADGRGIAAAFALGAEAVQMGTRFILAKECHAHQNYKESVLKARDRDTVMTGLKTGHPVRVIRNKLTKEYLDKEFNGASVEELEKMGQGRLKLSAIDGNTSEGSVMAGQVSGMLSKEQSAAEIILDLEADYKKTFDRLQSFKPFNK